MSLDNLEGMCRHHLNAIIKSRRGNPLNYEERQCAHACNGYHKDEYNGCRFNPQKDIVKIGDTAENHYV